MWLSSSMNSFIWNRGYVRKKKEDHILVPGCNMFGGVSQSVKTQNFSRLEAFMQCRGRKDGRTMEAGKEGKKDGNNDERKDEWM